MVDEHADTWGFAWMPAIEEFVGQAAAAAAAEQRDEDDSDDHHVGYVGDYDHTDDEEPGVAASRARASGGGGSSNSGSSHDDMSAGELLSGNSSGRNGRKRRRPQASGGGPAAAAASFSRRRVPRPPSYNETLFADKSFHNPHASETMADAFGILRPASFVLDVEADDRPWGGAGEAAAAPARAATEGATNDKVSTAKERKIGSADVGGGGGGEDRNNWFYDTVRDRQNRLWADTRVRKGVELARKGQHQVTACVSYHIMPYLIIYPLIVFLTLLPPASRCSLGCVYLRCCTHSLTHGCYCCVCVNSKHLQQLVSLPSLFFVLDAILVSLFYNGCCCLLLLFTTTETYGITHIVGILVDLSLCWHSYRMCPI